MCVKRVTIRGGIFHTNVLALDMQINIVNNIMAVSVARDSDVITVNGSAIQAIRSELRFAA